MQCTNKTALNKFTKDFFTQPMIEEARPVEMGKALNKKRKREDKDKDKDKNKNKKKKSSSVRSTPGTKESHSSASVLRYIKTPVKRRQPYQNQACPLNIFFKVAETTQTISHLADTFNGSPALVRFAENNNLVRQYSIRQIPALGAIGIFCEDKPTFNQFSKNYFVNLPQELALSTEEIKILNEISKPLKKAKKTIARTDRHRKVFVADKQLYKDPKFPLRICFKPKEINQGLQHLRRAFEGSSPLQRFVTDNRLIGKYRIVSHKKKNILSMECDTATILNRLTAFFHNKPTLQEGLFSESTGSTPSDECDTEEDCRKMGEGSDEENTNYTGFKGLRLFDFKNPNKLDSEDESPDDSLREPESLSFK